MASIIFRRTVYFLFAVWCAASFSRQIRAQTQFPLLMMPLPAHAVQGQGQFLINGTFGIALQGYTEPRLLRARQRFLDTLSLKNGHSSLAPGAIQPGELHH